MFLGTKPHEPGVCCGAPVEVVVGFRASTFALAAAISSSNLFLSSSSLLFAASLS